tara:strand:- start:1198 stop:1509 length:312 start_codon:yes stop_codon:yes gene_type:complete
VEWIEDPGVARSFDQLMMATHEPVTNFVEALHQSGNLGNSMPSTLVIFSALFTKEYMTAKPDCETIQETYQIAFANMLNHPISQKLISDAASQAAHEAGAKLE